MNIGIVGCGYIGSALAKFFECEHTVFKYDKNIEGLSDVSRKDGINACDLVFVCVGTPDSPSGCDLSAVFEVFLWLDAPACIKSTVLPGTTNVVRGVRSVYARTAFSPEFMGESEDHIWNSPGSCGFVIVAGDDEACDLVDRAYREVEASLKFFRASEPQVAEMCKYMVNCWLATKVAFVNQFFDLAAERRMDFSELRRLWLLDPRVGESHTIVTEERGFGGHCLPKDLHAIVAANSGSVELLEAVMSYNNWLAAARQVERA